MPMIDVGSCRINVIVEGSVDAPTLMLSNSLGTTMKMWDPQILHLKTMFRVIRYDRRGHGGSEVGDPSYSIEQFGRDAVAILDFLNVRKTHWCGLSMGGMVGQWLGARAADRIDKLILANTTSYYPDPAIWDARISRIRRSGLEAVADSVISGWFTPEFRRNEPAVVAEMKTMLTETPVEGYLACCDALRALDLRHLLPHINRPTLVIAGRRDAATPLSDGEFIFGEVSGARLTILDAAHISNVEQPQAFNDAVTGFLTAP